MSAHTKARATTAWAEIRVKVPAAQVAKVKKAIASVFDLAGVQAHVADAIDGDDDALMPADEVFSASTPGKLLRGLRTREDLTQAQLAKALGVHSHHISDMERGIRTISPAMARKLERIYKVPRQIFL